MKTRFKKVWCASCSTMQFAGECPHPPKAREVRPPVLQRAHALNIERFVGGVVHLHDWEAVGMAGILRIVAQPRANDLVLPPLFGWTEYKANEGPTDDAFSLAADG